MLVLNLSGYKHVQCFPSSEGHHARMRIQYVRRLLCMYAYERKVRYIAGHVSYSGINSNTLKAEHGTLILLS